MSQPSKVAAAPDGADRSNAPSRPVYGAEELELSAYPVGAPSGGDKSAGISPDASEPTSIDSLEAVDLDPRSSERRTNPVVLAIGAHPDDLELACGGTLARLSGAGYQVHGLVMSNGRVGGDSRLRPSEARASGRLLGLAAVEVLDFPDTALAENNPGLVRTIESYLGDLDPILILTHSEHDHHQDHHAVHFATMRAARRHQSVLCFESPSTTRGFDPGIFFDISDYLDVKIRAVRLHHDQSGKPYMNAERIRGIAAFRGAQAKTVFAEGFEVVRMLDSMPGALL